MKYFIFFIQLFAATANGQSNANLFSFKKHVENSAAKTDSNVAKNSMELDVTKINYLVPLANAYANKASLLKLHSKQNYYDDLSQALAFTGDFKSVLQCLHWANDPVDTLLSNILKKTVNEYKGAHLIDAKSMILKEAASRNVVMINEAHCKPVHRAFTYSLLADFYKMGFRYLAMETFNNTPIHSLKRLTINTGYYTAEPLGGELVRKALSLGFKLVSYEDTLGISNVTQRDSAQARHIYEIIQKEPSARILVHAGYGHIQKIRQSDPFIPMAYQFKNISNIDPLCIDQTIMTEGGNDGFSSFYYDLLIKRYPAKRPSVLVINNKPVNYISNGGAYDITIIHPRSSYRKGRASWYSLNNERKLIMMPATQKRTFLVQAYYLDEWIDNPAEMIPADQTYVRTKNNSYGLYLKKGKYKIVYRDMDYKILSSKSSVIN